MLTSLLLLPALHTPLWATVHAPCARGARAAPMCVAGAERLCEPGSLAGRVEDAVCRVYGSAGTERVRRSLQQLSTGEVLDRTLDPEHELMVQQAHSFIESLTPTPWHDAGRYKWAAKLAQKWTLVRDELREALSDGRLDGGNSVWGGLKSDRLEYGTDWKTLPLCDRTVWDATNSALFPQTCGLLHKAKVTPIEGP